MSTEKTVVVNSQPYRLTLTRGQRGGYGWEISVQGETGESVLEEVRRLDQELAKQYAQQQQQQQEG